MRLGDQTPCITEAVKVAGIWDPHFPVVHNSLIFPSLLPSVFSILANVNLALAMSVIGCIVASAIPVILYEIYREFLPPIYSFLASCLYAFYPFYLQLPVFMPRTGFAFLFVSLFLLLLSSKEINLKSKSLLLIIFAFSLITSHYGTAYMFMFLLIPISVLYSYEKKFRNFKGEFISFNFIVLFFVMAFSWYMYTSGAQNFNWGVNFGNHIVTNLNDFFNPEESAAMRAFVTRSVTPSFSLEATKWLLFILLIFIIIGAVKLLYLYIKNKINAKYAILTLAFCSVLLGLTQMGMPRIFGFSLLLTAPLSIWGLSEILRLIGIKAERKHLLIFSLYLFILFVFTYGIVANSINIITGEARDLSLHGRIKETILESNNLEFKRFIYWGWQPDSAFKAASWFFVHQNPNKDVYVDSLIRTCGQPTCLRLEIVLPREYGGRIISNLTQPKVGKMESILEGNWRSGYIFLSYHNTRENFIVIGEDIYMTSDFKDIFSQLNKVYDSGGEIIYEN